MKQNLSKDELKEEIKSLVQSIHLDLNRCSNNIKSIGANATKLDNILEKNELVRARNIAEFEEDVRVAVKAITSYEGVDMIRIFINECREALSELEKHLE